jgi:hypothetical protein
MHALEAPHFLFTTPIAPDCVLTTLPLPWIWVTPSLQAAYITGLCSYLPHFDPEDGTSTFH